MCDPRESRNQWIQDTCVAYLDEIIEKLNRSIKAIEGLITFLDDRNAEWNYDKILDVRTNLVSQRDKIIELLKVEQDDDESKDS